MARIVYLNHGMASPLNTGLELARRLRARGHDIVFVSPRDVRSQVEGAGFEFHHISRDVDLMREWETAKEADRAILREQSIENDEIERKVAELGAELLLIDLELHFAVIATSHLGIPTLLTINWFSIYKSGANPPMHTPRLPADTAGERLTVELAWLRLWAGFEMRLLRKRLRRKTAAGMRRPAEYETHDVSSLKAVARSRGWPFGRSTSRFHWLRPFTYTDMEILCFNAAEMDFPGTARPNLHYVGPMVGLERVETRLDHKTRTTWTRFVERSRSDPGRPLVYCSLGTFSETDRGFLSRVVEVFHRRRDWDLVLGLGEKDEAGDFDEIPDNVLVLSWAPQLEALANADCMISHGGITSINESISSGVPLLVYSTKEVDREGCAARVQFHGLGIAADKDADNAADIEMRLSQVLEDTRYRQNVEAMRTVFARYRTSQKAEQIVESRLPD